MADTPQHDPQTKSQIKTLIHDHLYKPIEKQFKDRLERIIIKNTLLAGTSHRSFMYKNVLYNCDLDRLPRKINRLAIALQPTMNEYLRDLSEVNDLEMPHVLGFINQVLNSSNDFHDYLRLLPQAVHYPLQEFINACPCRTKRLTDEEVDSLKVKNANSISMMKQRMVINLLI